MGILKNKKLQIVYDSETITILQAGFDKADPDAPIGSNKEALEAAKQKFKSPKDKKILDICSDGKVHTRAEVASRIGSDHTKKSFGNLLSPLRSAQYIDYLKNEDGEAAIQGTEELIPFDN